MSRLRRLLLRLPSLSERAASNQRLIQERIRRALDHLTRGAPTGDSPDGAALNDVGRELDDLEHLLKAQTARLRDGLDEDLSGHARDEPCATYLQLYQAEVEKGSYAAACPWFERYAECKQTRPEMRQPAPRRSKWRGPR